MKTKISLLLLPLITMCVTSCSSEPAYFYTQNSTTMSMTAPTSSSKLTDYVYEVTHSVAKKLIDRGLEMIYYIGEDEETCKSCNDVKYPLTSYIFNNDTLIYHTYLGVGYEDLYNAYKDIFPSRENLTVPSLFIINEGKLLSNASYQEMVDKDRFANYMNASVRPSKIYNVQCKNDVVNIINNTEDIMVFMYDSSLPMAKKAYQEGIYKYGKTSKVSTLFVDEDKFEEEDLFLLRAYLGVSILMGPTAHYYQKGKRKERMEFTTDSFNSCIDLLKSIY